METKTPQNSYPKLAKALGVSNIILKREDLNPYGSHKGRSIPLMIETYIKKGTTNFVISSSGNAALASIRYIQENNKVNTKVTLKILIGKNIEQIKYRLLQNEITDENIIIEQVHNPKQTAFKMDKEKIAVNLRQSTDDLALTGYKSLTKELKEIKNLQAIFIPTSSGTTAQALAVINTQIHIIQTTNCHPIAENFDKNFENTDRSIAGAIVDKVAHRKEKIIELIKKSQGFGWIATDKEIRKAIKLVKEKTDIDISPNSALSIAGLQKAIKNNWKWNGTIVCLITGK
ncbi:MAG: hypothetical protein A2725_03665 [Candidatus Magasanikbacteria bacterium RIFCSPHIGHO2_01_FULL_33_34]|uniref:Tryptophan synthase beta chain-like PALP domain-containing protein n=1 Tax=Candidatus Magasanikbacteria bacterium RIFCSPHIGHO2_01_FULL_33_34 TaxID=1798671 RepID=A0A1F6LHK2_9BACT|nr:MAG: hypothetical protein A2725_03665 [Candidatus Magasanikbacteria bacterium RIFCSPHIGHO2_01_FULL_33_34]OGH65069.1 MAG: hypothetical protein A3B83_03425 [Candidatus Magasanikbacteria bacterium RIFCSPHIGHO2_02_FULL_33_17]OGH75387.1 MAG: hypothetical protein A3A89_04740 [Candidatus Magasanikbacteria bacterium RIFCSPLOWO2_01_FULL_33_34]OGH81446.1 MAG: hypothetical protein A3F93_02530 [Candidatus Magasanikbacteria bacterium RIFCSPLOWO2_12_FULL_34_7]